MEEALRLLAYQPPAFPRWEVGVSLNAVPTEEQHLFLFERLAPRAPVGYVIPACRFVDGAEWIDRTADKIEDPTAPFCPNCLEVEIQHALK